MAKRKNGRRIGKDAELEAAGRFNALFGTDFYRSEQRKGATDSADLIDDGNPDLCIESKRRLFSKELHEAVEKARAEAGPGKSSFVLHRGPGERWLFTADLFELRLLVVRLARLLHATIPCGSCNGSGEFRNAASGVRSTCVDCDGLGIDSEDTVSAFLFFQAIRSKEVQAKVEADGVDGRKAANIAKAKAFRDRQKLKALQGEQVQ